MPIAEEIKVVVWDYDPTKALSYDGFNMKFNKEFWSEIRPDFMKCMLEFFASSHMERRTNMT